MSHLDLTNVRDDSANDIRKDQQSAWFKDEDEWEYEYDNEETEDFFLTLDLTTHLPDALVRREPAGNGIVTKGNLDLRLKEFRRMSKTPADFDDATPERQLEQPEGRCENTVAETPTSNDGEDGQRAEPTPQPSQPVDNDTIQLIGLHTSSPYIMFNDKFCTSYWLTDLGTQIWVTRPGVSESTIWSGSLLDVVGMSRVRLLARPAKLDPKYDIDPAAEHNRDSTSKDSTTRVATQAQQEPFNVDGPAQQLVIPTSSIADAHQLAQAAFMERLSALKIKKGEPDQMPLYSVKAYEFPDNAAEIRAAAWDAEDAERTRIEGPDDPGMPRLIREPNQPGRKYRKPGNRLGLKGKRANSSGARDIDSSDDEDNGASPQPDSPGMEDVAEQGEPPEGSAKRGPKKRSAKLASLGLTSQNPDTADGPPRKRVRRTKAQMEAARAEEAAARVQKSIALQADQ